VAFFRYRQQIRLPDPSSDTPPPFTCVVGSDPADWQPTSARFDGSFSGTVVDVLLHYDCAIATNLRIDSITPDPSDPPGLDNTPTADQAISVGTGTATFTAVFTAGGALSIFVSWDDADAFDFLCIDIVVPE
jgi:hypothetical protein